VCSCCNTKKQEKQLNADTVSGSQATYREAHNYKDESSGSWKRRITTGNDW